MSAFTKNDPNGIAANDYVQHQHWYPTVQQNGLPEFKLKFLNPEACQQVSPYNKQFWPALIDSLTNRSQQVMDLPKADCYRGDLERYRYLRVHITAESWSQREDKERGVGAPLHLVLRNPCVTHVHDRSGTAVTMPNATVDHMHIWVSVNWMNHVRPDPSEPLVLEGVLYEYASSSGTRNIGVLPVLLTDKSRKLDLDRDPRGREPQPSCSYQPACPEPMF